MAHNRFALAQVDYINRLNNVVDALDRRLKGSLLDNGAFQIWQRGTSIAAAAAAVFTADRWAFWRAAAATGATVSRQTGSLAQYCARVQRDSGNASTSAVNFAQAVESANAYPLRSRYVTLQFRARSGSNYSATSSLLTAKVISGTGTDESVSAGFTGQATVVTQDVTLTTSWQTFTLAATAPGASITQLGVQFAFTPTGTASTNDYFEVEQVQLVDGEFAGDFPYRAFNDELQACQRFFCKSFAIGTAPAQNVGTALCEQQFTATKAGASAQYSHFIPFPVRMRGTGTVTFYNTSVANAQARDLDASVDCSSTAQSSANERGFWTVLTGNASTAVGNRLAFNWSATADI